MYLKELILAEDMIGEQLFVEKNIQEVTLGRTLCLIILVTTFRNFLCEINS